MRVLVLDAQAKQALPVIRDLRAAGHEVYAASPTPWLAAACWSNGARRLRVQQSHDQAFVSQLAVLIGSYGIDVLLPLKDLTTRVVASHLEALAPVQTCLAPAETILKASHKGAVEELVQGTVLAAPRTIGCTELEVVQDVVKNASFPAVVKAAHGSGLVHYANDAGELASLLHDWIPRYGEVIVQEYVQGDGVGCFALYDRGACVCAYTHRRVREYPSTGGISLSAESTNDPELLAAGRQLLDALNWHGPAMVECKREHDTGRLVLIEVNTKFWGSLDLALACGLRIPRWAVAIAQGQSVSPQMNYPSGVRVHWPAPAGLAQAIGVRKTFGDWLGDCRDPGCRSDWRIADPLPHLVQIAQAFGLLWTTRGRWDALHGALREA